MMQAFSQRHPMVNFLFFLTVILCAMFFSHPAVLTVGLVISALNAALLTERKLFLRRLPMMLPIMLLTALINPLVSHEGATVLFLFPSGKACTLEALLYGVFAAVRLGTVLFWFVCWNAVITTDKFLFLFGRRLPALSLTLSMGLRFVPRLLRRFRETSEMQKCLNPNGKKLRHVGRVLSVTVTWALENALETADSMKSRGYGQAKRSSYSVFRFSPSDAVSGTILLCLGVVILFGVFCGAFSWEYFPSMCGKTDSTVAFCTAAFGIFAAFPMLTEGRRMLQWHLSSSKT